MLPFRIGIDGEVELTLRALIVGICNKSGLADLKNRYFDYICNPLSGV